MRIDVFHHIVSGSEILTRFDTVIGKLDLIIANQIVEQSKMAQIDDELVQLTDDVAAEKGAVDSAVVALNGIAAKVDAAVQAAIAAGATPAQLQAVTDLSASVKAQTADLSAAVAANP